MTPVTVMLLKSVENKTVCAATSDCTSYSKASVELLREAGKELAMRSDCAITPSRPIIKINANATAGPIKSRPKLLSTTNLFTTVFI